MVGTPSYDDDDYLDPADDLAALDFAFGTYHDAADVRPAGEHDVPLFAVTNPPGTVTVTTLMDGRVHRIELSPNAAASTEAHLADEIVVIAGLATQQAKSAQFSFMLEGMRTDGHDNAATRDFLNRDLDLPSPEAADAVQARIFATRYAGEHD